MTETKVAHRFKESFRFKNGVQIKDVLNHAKKYKERHLSIFIKPNHLSHPRLAIIITKKQIPKAVTRNHLKRIIRENFRLNQDKIEENDIIVFGYKGIENLTNKELAQCLTKRWLKLS